MPHRTPTPLNDHSVTEMSGTVSLHLLASPFLNNIKVEVQGVHTTFLLLLSINFMENGVPTHFIVMLGKDANASERENCII